MICKVLRMIVIKSLNNNILIARKITITMIIIYHLVMVYKAYHNSSHNNKSNNHTSNNSNKNNSNNHQTITSSNQRMYWTIALTHHWSKIRYYVINTIMLLSMIINYMIIIVINIMIVISERHKARYCCHLIFLSSHIDSQNKSFKNNNNDN